ncbi:MAG: DoxX family protein [Sporocytophaga sp.]|nr:DoxX family protein [Sporocytophaga sp.]
MKKNIDLGIFVTRIAIGFPMLVYGISKLFYGIDFIKDMLIEKGLPSFIAYGVFLGEVVAPILIIIGFRTRLAGFVFAVNCLTAICLTQMSNAFKLNDYGGWALELLAIYMLIATGILFTGGGKIAVSTNNQWD